ANVQNTKAASFQLCNSKIWSCTFHIYSSPQYMYDCVATRFISDIYKFIRLSQTYMRMYYARVYVTNSSLYAYFVNYSGTLIYDHYVRLMNTQMYFLLFYYGSCDPNHAAFLN